MIEPRFENAGRYVTDDELPIAVGFTGASGAVYGLRLIEALIELGHQVHLSISPSGREVLLQETGRRLDLDRFDPEVLLGKRVPADRLVYWHHANMLAPLASGSFLTRGMVICPCSGGTLSSVAHGASDNLVERAADAHLKERRPLILVPRETPLSLVHLDNMKRAAEVGAVILPASPGWYHGVSRLEDLVDFVVARILDQLRIRHDLMRRWGSPESNGEAAKPGAERFAKHDDREERR
ncbi:MAG TPA: flavin prenyltransferase UbiX [Pirellulaceae bacterium]|jgi:4-hydroxy-3-polyprenylbenzoate decarboxylase|nr:flavin prenyltransferase UbiX [Pirellulaceae bacterium]